MKEKYDAIIIGAGPAGCSAALHLAYHERSVLVLDRGTSPMYFHTNSILNFASSETYHEGRALLKQMQGVATKAGAVFYAQLFEKQLDGIFNLESQGNI